MISFDNLKYYDTPYKHFVIDDFFNDPLIYKKFYDEWGNPRPDFEGLGDIKNRDDLKKYFDENVLPVLLDKIEEHFGEVDRDVWIEGINIKNDTWEQRTSNPDPFASSEYLIGRPSHLDGPSKKYPMLIYFDDGSGEEGIPEYAGSFQLMDWENPEEVVKTVDFKNNRAVVFEASCISHHKYWVRPKNRLNLNIPIVNDKNNHELTQHYKNKE
jgi:hypothetical protein